MMSQMSNLSKFPSRSWSSSSRTSPVPGTSRQLLAGVKRRVGNVPVDVPSDESDEERYQSKRPRVRQRQMSQNLYRRHHPTDLGFSRRPSSSTDGSVKNLVVETGNGESGSPSPSSASHSPPVRQDPVNVGSGTVGGTRTKADTPKKGSTSGHLRRRKSVIRFNGGEKDWTMFSLWMPSWKDKLKCDNGTLPTESSELAKDILNAVEMMTPFITDYKQRRFKLMQVQKTEEDGEGNAKILMKRCVFRSDPSPHPTSPEPVSGEIRLISSDVVIGKIFSDILSVDDIILLFKPSSDGLPDVVIHLTTRDCDVQSVNPYHPGTFQKLYVHVYNSTDSQFPYQWNKMLQFYSLNFRWNGRDCDKTQNPNNSVNSSISSGIPVGDNSCNLNNSPDSDDVFGAANLNSMNACDDDADAVVNSGLEGHTNVNFDIERFARVGVILPGPMREPVKKVDSTNNYTYHTLDELAKMLKKSMEDDSKGSKVISGTIKHQCHAYGMVVKIITEHRHQNAYLIRITDGTMDSVLVRLHTSLSGRLGPTIRIGDIIRVHRLTVQIEWDSERNSNTMVLSTTQHVNYVLFRESPDNNKSTVRYHTCAKSMTLGGFDKTRVEELLRLKQSNRIHLPAGPQTHNSKVQVTHSPGSSDLNTNGDKEADERSNSPETNGINSPDLDSPHPSVVSVGGSEPQRSPPLIEDMEQDDCIRLSDGNDNEAFQDASQYLPDESGSEKSTDSFRTAQTSSVEIIDIHSDLDEDRSCVAASPMVSSDVEETLQAGGVLHLRQCLQPESVGTYTCFMNLTKNGSKPTLLCTLSELGATSGANTWRLIIQDGESTLPKEDFKNNEFLDGDRLDTHLVLNIANARRLAERGILSQVHDSIGTDELYILEDVEIQGDRPPYSLVVDGNTCVIRLATYEDLSRNFNLTCTQGSSGLYALSLAEIPINSGAVVSTSQDNLTTPTKKCNKAVKRPREVSSSVEVTPVAKSSSRISGPNAVPTPSPVTSPNEGKPWDGKVTCRRKRRQHYQSEASMDC